MGTWEHWAILEGNKGTRSPPGRTSEIDAGVVQADLKWNLKSAQYSFRYKTICSLLTAKIYTIVDYQRKVDEGTKN